MKKITYHVVVVKRNKYAIDKYYRTDRELANSLAESNKLMWPMAKVTVEKEEIDIDGDSYEKNEGRRVRNS